MGKEITTFKLDPERIRTNLVVKIKRTTGPNVSFFDYLSKLNSKRELHHKKYLKEVYEPFRPYDPDQIICSLMDVQNLASVDDLGITFDWLLEIDAFEWDKKNGYASSYANYGFDTIYDLGVTDKCWVYGNQRREYEFMNNQDYDHYDGSYDLYPNDYYRNYLDYLQLLLAKICLDTDYKMHVVDYLSNDNLISYVIKHQVNQKLNEQTEMALAEIRRSNEAHDIEIGDDGSQSRYYTQSHYLVADEMFYHINEVRDLLGEYEGNIFIGSW